MVFLIGIAGPTCSGKTSLCKTIKERLDGVTLISLDDFLVDKEDYPLYKSYVNMDSPDGVNFNESYRVLSNLKNGLPTRVPEYDMENSRRIGFNNVYPSKIILVEGFLLFYKENISDLFDMKLFLDLPIDKQKERRIKRGIYCNCDYFDEVLTPMYHNYVEPTISRADFVLNASLEPKNVYNNAIDIIKHFLDCQFTQKQTGFLIDR